MKTYRALKKQLLTDKDVRKAYDALAPTFAVIEKLIERRLKKRTIQGQL